MDDSEDEALLGAYQSYAHAIAQESVEDELLLRAYENYITQSEPKQTEDEFLLKAYRDYINDAVEWPNFHNVEAYRRFQGDQAKPMPLLIRECARLIPTISQKNDAFVDFHPFNMPLDPIKSINVIGTIVGCLINKRYLDIKVYDGTGTLTVLYNVKKYQIDQKRRQEINRKHGVSETDVGRFTRLMKQTVVPDESTRGRCNPAVQRIRRFQRDYSLWWDECERGMLGAPLEIGSHVSVYGFCNLKCNRSRRDRKSNDFWDTGVPPVLIFNAYAVASITETEYNAKLQGWLTGVFAMKYLPNKA